MAKLIMMMGLPASGKSTRAKEIVEGGGQFIRVNRDLLRTMLHFNRFTGKNEGITVNVERAIAVNALANGINVVVDDCNLNPKNHEMWRQVARECDAKFETENIKTDPDECVRRDRDRADKVGKSVIMGMALQYRQLPLTDKGFVLCDLDGTLCDLKHRLKYAKPGPDKNWDTFFSLVGDDILRGSTLALLEEYRAKGHEIIFVSARPERCRKDTEMWLMFNLPPEFEYKALFMRSDRDSRDDVIVKQEIYEKLFKDKYPIETVIDDRPKVIRMWREQGISVIDVGEGVEF